MQTILAVLVIILLLVWPDRVLLEQNDIEDHIDASINLKKLHTENKPPEKDNSYNYDDSDDDKYNMKFDMPEYNLETKADFQGNKEAADWLMNDPNRYNVMPNKDSKAFIANDEDFDKSTSNNPELLYKQFIQDIDNQSNNLLGHEELGDDDQNIIDKAYSLDEYDKENEYGEDASDKHNGLGTEDYSNKNFPDNESPGRNDEDVESNDVNEANVKNESSGSEEDQKEKGEPRIKVTNDNDGISSDINTIEPVSDQTKMQKIKSTKENSDNVHVRGSKSDNEEHDQSATIKDNKSIPVYRLKHFQNTLRIDQTKLAKTKPLSESGMSRQHVLLNSNPVATEDPEEMTARMNSFQNMMLARHEEERMAKLYNFPRRIHHRENHELQEEAVIPEDKVEGEIIQGTPFKYGDWNGWSKCSVTCSKGTQIRARMCSTLPCQSTNLYQTRTCIRNICPDKWREQSLHAHNHLRKLHHSPPLVWSNTLAKKAKDLANALAAMDYIGSQDLREETGENIAQLHIKPGSYNELAKKAVDVWYKEATAYSFSYPQLTPSNRHFIQMIWKKTKTLGMASTSSRSGEYTFVVALYGGPGIDRKKLRDNVLRSGEKSDVYTTFKRNTT